MNLRVLLQSIARKPRRNLIFVQGRIEGLSYVDVGKELSKQIADYVDDDQLPMLANQKFDAMIAAHVHRAAGLGKYVALQNIGILFEPELALNILGKFGQYTQSLVLIVNMEGDIDGSGFHFMGKRDSRCTLPMDEAAYKVLRINL